MGYDRAVYRRIREGSVNTRYAPHMRNRHYDMEGDYSPEYRKTMRKRHASLSDPEYLQPGREVKGKIVWPHYVREMLRELEDAE